MLRDGQFYLLWILFLFGGTGAVFLEAMYKVMVLITLLKWKMVVYLLASQMRHILASLDGVASAADGIKEA